MMWNFEIQKVHDSASKPSVQKFFLRDEANRVSCEQVIQLWLKNDLFNEWFSGQLVSLSLSQKAVRWETPFLTRHNLDRDFEFVLVDSPRLDRRADPSPFANQFAAAEADSVIAFPNLGRNGIMIVPVPGPDHSIYCHLLSFLRGGTRQQSIQLWRTVGEQMENRVNEIPVWLSTAGGGVAWLHVRLDDRPKYYSYAPYKNVTGTQT